MMVRMSGYVSTKPGGTAGRDFDPVPANRWDGIFYFVSAILQRGAATISHESAGLLVDSSPGIQRVNASRVTS